MKPKKIILAGLLGIGLAVCCFTAQAQYRVVYGPNYLANGTNYIAGSAAKYFLTSGTFDVTQQRNLSVFISYASDAAGDKPAFVFIPSVDGVAYASNSCVSITLPATAVTPLTIMTNLDSYGWGYWKLFYVTNSHASANITNLVVVGATTAKMQ